MIVAYSMLNVKLISMNYENVCGYLCFCCADAVDCGAGGMSCMGGLDGVGWVAAALPPLWIADQVRNDVTVLIVLACCRPHPAPLDCGSSPQ